MKIIANSDFLAQQEIEQNRIQIFQLFINGFYLIVYYLAILNSKKFVFKNIQEKGYIFNLNYKEI